MDYLQLKMTPHRITAIADAIERDIGAHPEHPDRGELSHAMLWLRHRVAVYNLTATQPPQTDSDD